MDAKDTLMRYEHKQAIKDKVERDYKEKKGYQGLDWAYTHEDRRNLKIEMEIAIEEKQADVSFKAGIREVVKFINDLIIGIDNCKFEERLDGDKGCIVLDMNENQWRVKLKEWGIE